MLSRAEKSFHARDSTQINTFIVFMTVNTAHGLLTFETTEEQMCETELVSPF